MPLQWLHYKKTNFLPQNIYCIFGCSKDTHSSAVETGWIWWKEESSLAKTKTLSLVQVLYLFLKQNKTKQEKKMVSKLVVFCLVLGAFSFGLATADEATTKKDGYDTKYDNIDLDELLKNDRLRKNYVKCLLNEGPCTPDATELKSKIKIHTNPFKLITDSVSTLKEFLTKNLVRLTSRRDSHQLLKMHREAKKWFRKSDTLSNW